MSWIMIWLGFIVLAALAAFSQNTVAIYASIIYTIGLLLSGFISIMR